MDSEIKKILSEYFTNPKMELSPKKEKLLNQLAKASGFPSFRDLINKVSSDRISKLLESDDFSSSSIAHTISLSEDIESIELSSDDTEVQMQTLQSLLQFLQKQLSDIDDESEDDIIKYNSLILLRDSSTRIIEESNTSIDEAFDIGFKPFFQRIDRLILKYEPKEINTEDKSSGQERFLEWNGRGLSKLSKELYRAKLTEKPTSFENIFTKHVPAEWLGDFKTLAHLIFSLRNLKSEGKEFTKLKANDGQGYFETSLHYFSSDSELLSLSKINLSDLAHKVRSKESDHHTQIMSTVKKIIDSVPSLTS
jgi:hypothetical protein